ncbi:GNAT family N-acetyltransferase [Candidatus Nitrosotenuis sp. DW1]|uniref:GNAT family N-acetyltransferase n=1 Tax=Candidatus Nitrosotenuis sp. DW1 TaxID=2259672 RepID=UPI00403E33B6
MNNFKIRKASKKDINEILELLYQLQRPRPKTKAESLAFRKRIRRYFDEKDKIILVAKQNSKAVGLVSMMFLPRLNRTKLELYIPELVVSEDHRKSGIGKSLIESCIHTAKKKKCFRIRLESGNQRKGAHLFYKKIGFEQSALSYTMMI